jgi:HSP20 family molecular chaperone IbpA
VTGTNWARQKLAARYQDGILEVTVPIVAAQAQPRIIPVARDSTK